MERDEFNKFELDSYESDVHDQESLTTLTFENKYTRMEEKVVELRWLLCQYAQETGEKELFYHFDFYETALLLYKKSYVDHVIEIEEMENVM
jgi:hypothetical protein